ncbi:tetratricopeptide repeat protein [Agarivorans sp. QJM3NY_29]|uniref:tetratricopeptide repeat protein n=1 Tax=unclassified Agarivorans TaxID=2636026 RepID=UPI003D7C4457
MPNFSLKSYLWFALVLLCGPFSANSWAYENGFINVPKTLEPLRQQLIANPRNCLEHLAKTLNQQETTTEQTVTTGTIDILRYQIAALCAYRTNNPQQAQVYIHHAIRLAKQQPTHLTQAYIIAALAMSSDPKWAIQAQDYIALAQAGIEKLKIFPLSNMRFQLQKVQALYYQNQGKNNEAKNHLLKAKEEAYTSKSPILRAWSEALLADYYLLNKQPELALNHLTEAELDDQDIHNNEALLLNSKLKANMAQVYLEQGELVIAQQFQQDAIDDAASLNNLDLQAEEITKLADMTKLAKDNDAALVHYLNAKEIAKANHNLPLLADIELRLGSTYMEFTDYTPALVHLQIARQLFTRLNQPSKLLHSLLLLGELHINNHESGLAILQLEKAEALANTIGLSNSHSKVYKLLTEAYEQNGNYALALEEFKIYHSLNQQYQQISNELKREQFKQHYQYIEQAQQLSDLTKEKALIQQQSSFQQLVLVLVCVFAVMILFLFLITRQKLLSRKALVRHLNQQLNQHPITGWQQLANSDSPLQYLRKQHLSSTQSPQVLLLISIEHLSTVGQHSLGFKLRREFNKNVIEALITQFDKDYQLGHINDHQLLICLSLKQLSAEQICRMVVDEAERYAIKQKLKLIISIGTCIAPFLTKAEDAIDDSGMTEVLWLALEGAQQLSAHTQQNQWVELTAMKGSHAAFFCSDIRQDVKQAISKGLVKVNSSTDKSIINW